MTLERPAGTASKLGTYELLKEQPGIGVGATWIARTVGDASESPKLFSVLRVHKHLTKKPEMVEAFVAEARPVTGFRHPNVSGLVEIGNETGELYLVSEHHDGETLAGLVTAAGALGFDGGSAPKPPGLPQPVVLRILADVLGALVAAHANDPPFAHGELGPQHVLVGDDGVSRLGGLVVSRAFSKVTPPVGAKNHDRLSYAAPERVKTLASPAGSPATPQGDVFSMGVILWEALAHQRLFTSKIEAAIVQKVLTAPIGALASLPGASVAAPLAEAVHKALERDPAKRTPSAAELLAEIEALGAGAIATAGEVSGVVERLAGKAIAARKGDVRNEIVRRLSKSKASTIPPPAAPKPVPLPRKATLLGINMSKPAAPVTTADPQRVPQPPPAIPAPSPKPAEVKAVPAVEAPHRPPAESMNLEELEVFARPPPPPPPKHRATLPMVTALATQPEVARYVEEKLLPAPAKPAVPVPPAPASAQTLLEASGKTATPSSDGPSPRSRTGMAIEKVGPGSTLGRYEILMGVARGGMASVWAAKLPGSRGFQKIFAIKTMLPDVSDDPDFEEMFLDEGKVAARIRHPNVVEIIDLGEQDDVLYLVMEWVEGDNLGSLIKAARAHGGVPMPIILRIASQVCAGLHAAHELRDDDGSLLDLIHRDISPANVLVSTTGLIKIVDFGIAKSKARLHVTRVGGMVKGKTPYLSPEQLGQQPTDRRSDIFSLGALLYVLTTGLHPFRGDSDSKTIENIALREPVPLSALAPATPPEFESVVLKALAKDPKDRFATAADMQRAVNHVAGALGFTTTEEDVAAFVRKALGEPLGKRAQELRSAIERAESTAARPSEASIDASSAAPAHLPPSKTPPQPFAVTPAVASAPEPARIAAAALPPPPPPEPVEEEISFEGVTAPPEPSVIAPPPVPAAPQLGVDLTADRPGAVRDLPRPKQPEAVTLPEIPPPPFNPAPRAPEISSRDEATSRPVMRSDSDETTVEVQGLPRKRRPVGLYAVGAALGLCVLVGLAAIFTGGKKDAGDKPTIAAGPVGQAAITAAATQTPAPEHTVAAQTAPPPETAAPAPTPEPAPAQTTAPITTGETPKPPAPPVASRPMGNGTAKTPPFRPSKPRPSRKPYNPGTL